MTIDHFKDEKNLASALKHELGANLRAIVQFSSLIERRMDEVMDQKTHYWLSLIHENGVHAQLLLDTIHSYLMLSSDGRQNEMFSIQEIIKSAESSLDEVITTSGAEIHLPNNDLKLKGYADLWFIAIRCILDNSILYQLPDSAPFIDIQLEETEHSKAIIFNDNGIGVSVDNLSLITLPFKRLHGNEFPGLGMGLTKVKRIVEMHDGVLEFKINKNNGLSVKITMD